MKKFWKKKQQNAPNEGEDNNIIRFPKGKYAAPTKVDEVRQRMEEYSSNLYEGELEETTGEAEEDLIPHTDAEEQPREYARQRRHIKEARPDTSPVQLAKKYGAGLKFLRLRINCVLMLAVFVLYLTLAEHYPLPLPSILATQWKLQVWLCGGMLAAAMLLSLDGLLKGIFNLGIGLLMTLSCAASVADAFTMPILGSRGESFPFCVVNLFALATLLGGEYLKKRGLRTACRTAVMVRNPYFVTLDENSWSGRDAYARWLGSGLGYGSQIQGVDGTQRVMRIAAPLLAIAAVLFSMLSSLGRGRPELFLWCFSALLTAASSFSAALVFVKPFDRLATRLSKSGTALGGWAGLCTAGQDILITDQDLFPSKTIHISQIQTFGSFGELDVVAYTATLVREGRLGLARMFHSLMRQMDVDYCWVDELIRQEGGITAMLAGGEVSIGTGDFMKRTGVVLPSELDLSKMLLCSVNGCLAGAFTLEYEMNAQVLRAVRTLLKNDITPVLATRDFSITPDMLRQRFKLPVEKMKFPAAARRVALSDSDACHDPAITAVLYKEGLIPFAEAVVAAKRLRSAALIGTWLSVSGSAVGILLAYYLTFVEAYSALSPLNLLVFMVAWFIPAMLIAGIADFY